MIVLLGKATNKLENTPQLKNLEYLKSLLCSYEVEELQTFMDFCWFVFCFETCQRL